jgi:hypothetical protein
MWHYINSLYFPLKSLDFNPKDYLSYPLKPGDCVNEHGGPKFPLVLKHLLSGESNKLKEFKLIWEQMKEEY